MKISIGLKAFLLQIFALAIGFVCLVLVYRVFGYKASPILFLFCCGVGAAALSILLKFDWWWVPIHCLFLPLIYLASLLHLSPSIYLAALLISLLLFWSTYRTQVPYYPSSKDLVPPLVELLGKYEVPRLVDVGSGFGGLLFDLSNRVPRAQFLGIEIAPLPYFVSMVRGFLLRSNVKFVFGAYESLSFAEFDVVFCYLSPVAMPSIWQKARAEMLPGSVLLSYEFIVPDVAPSFVLEIGSNASPLYCWRI